VTLATAIMTGIAAAARAGAFLFLVGVLLFASQIGRVAFGSRVRTAGGNA
jgi:hypothetical protein